MSLQTDRQIDRQTDRHRHRVSRSPVITQTNCVLWLCNTFRPSLATISSSKQRKGVHHICKSHHVNFVDAKRTAPLCVITQRLVATHYRRFGTTYRSQLRGSKRTDFRGGKRYPRLKTTNVISSKQPVLYPQNNQCCILKTTSVVSSKQPVLYPQNNQCYILKTTNVISSKQPMLHPQNNQCYILMLDWDDVKGCYKNCSSWHRLPSQLVQ